MLLIQMVYFHHILVLYTFELAAQHMTMTKFVSLTITIYSICAVSVILIFFSNTLHCIYMLD